MPESMDVALVSLGESFDDLAIVSTQPDAAPKAANEQGSNRRKQSILDPRVVAAQLLDSTRASHRESSCCWSAGASSTPMAEI